MGEMRTKLRGFSALQLFSFAAFQLCSSFMKLQALINFTDVTLACEDQGSQSDSAGATLRRS